jgi:hypothetical protein
MGLPDEGGGHVERTLGYVPVPHLKEGSGIHGHWHAIISFGFECSVGIVFSNDRTKRPPDFTDTPLPRSYRDTPPGKDKLNGKPVPNRVFGPFIFA